MIAAASLYAMSVLVQEKNYYLAILPSALLGLLSISEFVIADLIIDARFPPDTARFLDRLQKKMGSTSINDEIVDTLDRCVRTFQGCDRSQISSTLHLRVDVLAPDSSRRRALIQVSNYTMKRLGGRRWRELDASKGLAGRCLRLGELVFVNFRDEGEFTRCMVEEFGFTSQEAEEHTQKARSYLAFPLKDEEETVGVLYFHSTEPQAFPHCSDVDALQAAADGIAGLLRAAELL
jgi:GAF domain-containing protein